MSSGHVDERNAKESEAQQKNYVPCFCLWVRCRCSGTKHCLPPLRHAEAIKLLGYWGSEDSWVEGFQDLGFRGL